MTVQSITLASTGEKVKFGRNRPTILSPYRFKGLSLSPYLVDLPKPPDVFDYTDRAQASLSRMMMNNELGCCVPTGGGHALGVLTGNAGTIFVESDEQVVRDYSAIGGYQPGNPGTDNGCDEQVALEYWRTRGMANGTKLAGWLAVNPNNIAECVSAMYLFEHLLVGCELPNSWVKNVKPNFVWDADRPNPQQGHCFILCGRRPGYWCVSTWGMLGWMTDRAMQTNIQELYVMCSRDILDRASQKSPTGVDWKGVITYFNSLGGNLPVPDPTPPPNPPPNPITPPAPSTVQTVIDALLASLRQRFAGFAWITRALDWVKSMVDQWFGQNPAVASRRCDHEPAHTGNPMGTPSVISQVLGQILAALMVQYASNPEAMLALEIVKWLLKSFVSGKLPE